MKAVIFSAMADPSIPVMLWQSIKTTDFNGLPVQYVLADEVSAGMPFTTLSLSAIGLRLDVQTHGIAAVLSGPGMGQIGFVQEP
jgi:hypothetical protein